MNKKVKRICENLDWSIHEYENDVELEKFSPAGEDFFFCVDKKNFINNVIEYAEDFDSDEHAEMWVENRHTVSGVPQSIRTLMDDADAIKKMLLELAENLNRKIKTRRKINDYIFKKRRRKQRRIRKNRNTDKNDN